MKHLESNIQRERSFSYFLLRAVGIPQPQVGLQHQPEAGEQGRRHHDFKFLAYSYNFLSNFGFFHQLAGCRPLCGPINPLAGQPVDWPRSAWPIEKYPNFQKQCAKSATKGFHPPSWAVWEILDFNFSSNFLPPLTLISPF